MDSVLPCQFIRIGTFTTTLILATVIAALSLIPDKSWMGVSVVTAVWCAILIILLFLFAYRRALSLISPTMQLTLVVADTEKNFKTWNQMIKRTTPIFQANAKNDPEAQKVRSKHDMSRLTFFQFHPNWTASAEQAALYCVMFSRRYSEQGDHEVARVALNGIVAVNAFYIRTKGKTFFSNSYIVDNPLASDKFLNNTLEHLRQNVQIAVSRKDEQFIEQNFRCLLQLEQLYINVQYGGERDSHSHAHLITTYLVSAVESVVPHDMADVLIEGVSILGQSARLIISLDNSHHISSITEKISQIACRGTANKNYQVVSQNGR